MGYTEALKVTALAQVCELGQSTGRRTRKSNAVHLLTDPTSREANTDSPTWYHRRGRGSAQNLRRAGHGRWALAQIATLAVSHWPLLATGGRTWLLDKRMIRGLEAHAI
jgi:hypothetical protein